MYYYPSNLPPICGNEAPRTLIAITKSNQSQGPEVTLKGPTFLPHLYAPIRGSVLEV